MPKTKKTKRGKKSVKKKVVKKKITKKGKTKSDKPKTIIFKKIVENVPSKQQPIIQEQQPPVSRLLPTVSSPAPIRPMTQSIGTTTPSLHSLFTDKNKLESLEFQINELKKLNKKTTSTANKGLQTDVNLPKSTSSGIQTEPIRTEIPTQTEPVQPFPEPIPEPAEEFIPVVHRQPTRQLKRDVGIPTQNDLVQDELPKASLKRKGPSIVSEEEEQAVNAYINDNFIPLLAEIVYRLFLSDEPIRYNNQLRDAKHYLQTLFHHHGIPIEKLEVFYDPQTKDIIDLSYNDVSYINEFTALLALIQEGALGAETKREQEVDDNLVVEVRKLATSYYPNPVPSRF